MDAVSHCRPRSCCGQRHWRACISCMTGSTRPKRKPRPLVASFSIFAAKDPSAEMKRYLAARPALEIYFRGRDNCDRALELLAPFHAELLPLLPSLAPLWTHNDLHASNLFWSDATERAQAVADDRFRFGRSHECGS
jgi:hypothetical protein